MYLRLFAFLFIAFAYTGCQKNKDSLSLVEEIPNSPTQLTISEVTSNSILLSWNDNNDSSLDGFNIYQDSEFLARTNETSYRVENLKPNTQYSFAVSALAKNGNESIRSLEASVTTPADSFKVLLFTKTSGFNHNTKTESADLLQQIGSMLGFDVIIDDTGEAFNSLSNLSQYQVIFFANTSGNTLTQSQRNNVESYAAQGGNFISNHAASDSYGHSSAATVSGNGKGVWDWYSENITGCSVRNNPNHTPANFAATVSIANNNSVLTTDISFPWEDNEEWYYWEGGYIDASFTELLNVSATGTNSYDELRMTAHYWERPDGGKSFYTSMGHAKGKYADAEFVQLISNAFEFMLP